MRIVSQEQPHAFSTSVGVWLALGSRDESKERAGLSHFLEHMAFKGTGRRSVLDIARQIDRLGGNINAFTSKEHTCFYGRAISSNLATMTDLLIDIAFNPLLRDDDLNVERNVILQEIAGVEDTPDDLAFVLFQNDFWPHHALGRSVLGYPETVAAFSVDDFKAYIGEYHKGPQVVIAAVGALSHNRLVDMLAPALSALPAHGAPGRSAAPVPSFGSRVVERDTEQEHIMLGFPGLSAAHPRRIELGLLNLVLGGNMSSRLFQEIRERRGLAYAVYSFLNPYDDSGLWSIYLGVPPERGAESLEVVRSEFKKLREQAVSADELNDAKQSLEGSILLAAENMESRASRLARSEFIFGRDIPLTEILSDLAKITVDDLQQLASEMLDESKLRVLALGPLKEEDLPWK